MFFWKKSKKEELKQEWPFNEAENSGIITTRQVLEGHAILHVVHDEEGGWQMLCGTTSNEEDARVVSLRTIYQKDPSLADIANLPFGKEAYRKSADHSWVRI